MMNDLIEREAVIAAFEHAYTDVYEEYAEYSSVSGFSKDKVVEVLQSIATIDAVPVVRCKDCKHYKEFRTKKYKQLMRMCYRRGKYDGEFYVKADDFCSYGERRNENG